MFLVLKQISNDELYLLGVLERVTGAKANDVVQQDDGVVFVVAPGELGRAIGKQGVNIKRLREVLDKKVDIVEYDADVNAFLGRLFLPAAITGISETDVMGRKILQVRVDPEKKGLAIGKGGEKIKRARVLCNRLFGVDDVKVL